MCKENLYAKMEKLEAQIRRRTIQGLNPWSPGIREVIAIFWTINDPPGLQGLKLCPAAKVRLRSVLAKRTRQFGIKNRKVPV